MPLSDVQIRTENVYLEPPAKVMAAIWTYPEPVHELTEGDIEELKTIIKDWMTSKGCTPFVEPTPPTP